MAHSFPSSALHSESSTIHESQAPSHSPKHVAQQDSPTPRGWVQRSEFFTWNFFTANMGTGAIAILVNSAPAFRGQREIGTIWFFFDLVLFLVNVALLLTKATKHPRAFKASLYDHEDGLYLPCMNLAFATLFVGAMNYGVPYCGFWLTRAMMVLWVIYIAWGLFVALLLEWTIRGRNRHLSTITPADCLPVFPLMLAGTLGGALAKELPGGQAGYVIVLSYIFQGMGFFIGLIKLSVWMHRNMTLVNPSTNSIPGYLMAVGPPGFTAFALLNLGSQCEDAFTAAGILNGAEAGRVMLYVSVWWSLMLFGICVWLVFMPMVLFVGSAIKRRDLAWSMGFWSFTFPLVGFFMSAAQFGKLLPSFTFQCIHILGLVFVSFAWCMNAPMMAYGVFVKRDLCMPKAAKEKEVTVREGDEETNVAMEPGAAGMRGVKGGERRRRVEKESVKA